VVLLAVFLGLTEEEREYIEMKLSLCHALRASRKDIAGVIVGGVAISG
jgi:hypothetical protein